ncbi:MAG: exosortase A [Pseudomonadota bacterium]
MTQPSANESNSNPIAGSEPSGASETVAWATPVGEWRQAVISWFVVAIAAVALMWQTVETMVLTWWNSATFNHILLIPFIVGWLVWQRKDALKAAEVKPWLPALLILVGAVMLWLLGRFADAMVVQHFAFVFLLQGLTISIFGIAVSRVLFFPLCYMIFLVPFGSSLIPPMQDFTAHFIVRVLQFQEIPVFLDGVFLMTPSGEFQVAEACSGVRFLIATIAVGVLFANLCFRSWTRRAIIVFLSAAIPIIANGIRAWGIVYIAYLTDNKVATGVDHVVYGWGFFAFVLLAFIMIGMSFSDRPIDDPMVSNRIVGHWNGLGVRFGLGQPLIVALIGFTFVVAAPAYSNFVDARRPATYVTELTAPTLEGWTKVEENRLRWRPYYAGADAELVQRYRRGEETVTLYLGLYNYQRGGAELIAYDNTAIAPKSWFRATSSAVKVEFQSSMVDAEYHRINGGRSRVRDLIQVFWVGDRLTGSKAKAKIYGAAARALNGELAAGVIAISSERQKREVDNMSSLESFMAALPAPQSLFGMAEGDSGPALANAGGR